MSDQPITEEERVCVEIMRLNKLLKKREINKKWRIGKREVCFHWQSKNNLWGRFGGGWNWKLGVQIGGSTIIISLLICEIRVGKAMT